MRNEFEVGDYVYHKIFGNGVVTKVNNDGSVRVKFDRLSTFRTIRKDYLI